MARRGRRAERTRWPPSRSGEPTRPGPGAGCRRLHAVQRQSTARVRREHRSVYWNHVPSRARAAVHPEAPWPEGGGVARRCRPRCGGSGPSPGRMRLLRRLVTAAESAGEPRPLCFQRALNGVTSDARSTAMWRVGLPLGGVRIRQAESQWKPFGRTFAREMCESAHPTWSRDPLARSGPPKHAGYVLARSVHSVPPRWKLPAAAVGN